MEKIKPVAWVPGHDPMLGEGWWATNPIVYSNEYASKEGMVPLYDQSAIDALLTLDWQPIETAPDDGKCLLAVESDDGYWFGQLDRDERGNWIHKGEPTFCHSYYFNPTHWIPLPEPPE